MALYTRFYAAALALCLLLIPALACAQSAVVDNGSDPGSMLNLRSAPASDAQALGQFYSGTQVEITGGADGGWAQVEMGGGAHSVCGYMKREYLSSASAVNATYTAKVISPYGTQSVVLRSKPSDSYNAVAMLRVGQEVTVIGVSGDFYYVRLADSSVGCLASDEVK